MTRRATANTVWAAVSSSSSRWAASTGRPLRLPEAIANTSGRVPTSSVHWLILEETTAVSASLVFSRQAYNATTSSSGASEASGATHWTSRNSLTPSSVPVSTSDSAKCSATSRITTPATANIDSTLVRRARLPIAPTQAAGPIRSGSVWGALEIRRV